VSQLVDALADDVDLALSAIEAAPGRCEGPGVGFGR
jgi:hypothetical protein